MINIFHLKFSCHPFKTLNFRLDPVSTQKVRVSKTIILPFEEATYDDLFADKAVYKAFIMEQMHQYPELFPPGMKEGWSFHGVTKPSTKQDGLQLRRILTKSDQEVWHCLYDALYDL